MTKIERQTAEAVIALLESVDMLGLPGSTELRHMGVALRAALDADRAPRECDPYPVRHGFAAQVPPPLDGNWQAWRERTNELRREANSRRQSQQYDADPPQEPGRETPDAPK